MSTYMKGAVESSGVAKNLASTLLNMETTVMEYDLENASRLQAGVLFNLALMWYLHFRLNKVHPLLMQTVTGCLQLVFNPLFQIYVSVICAAEPCPQNRFRPHSGAGFGIVHETEHQKTLRDFSAFGYGRRTCERF